MATMQREKTEIEDELRNITTTTEAVGVIKACYENPLAEVSFREKSAQDSQNYLASKFWADVRKIIVSAH